MSGERKFAGAAEAPNGKIILSPMDANSDDYRVRMRALMTFTSVAEKEQANPVLTGYLDDLDSAIAFR